MKKNAIVLLSGGLDSTTTLYWAMKKGYNCQAIIFNYGQKHKKEINAAKKIARINNVPYQLIKFSLPWKGSSLLDKSKPIPNRANLRGIPSTYVPARNTIFISYALSYAEAIKADYILIGANAVDYSGYPDCRPDYYKVFQNLINKALKINKVKILIPLLNLTKVKIIRLAKKLNVPINQTWSCYEGKKKPCGKCDSCRIRNKALLATK